MKHTPRKWQKTSFKIIDSCIMSGKNEIIPVNACVGSGKTDVAFESFVRFINANKNDYTIQVFITPSINLNKQQAIDLRKYLDNSGLSAEDVDVFRNDCQCEGDQDMELHNIKKINIKSNLVNAANHIIIVVCEESFWGVEKNSANNVKFPRFNNWIHFFNELEAKNFKFGCIAFDEAHNYQTKQIEMFGKEYFDSPINDVELSTEPTNAKCTQDYFKMIMLMSGTPYEYQKVITKLNKQNECKCSPKDAIREHWICRPTLNFIVGLKTAYVRGAVAIVKRELENYRNEVFIPHILFNFGGIDELQSVKSALIATGKVGKEFHIIGLHSDKEVRDEAGNLIEFHPFMDEKLVNNSDAREAISKLDNDKCFNDNLPVIVMQVDMISEGLNVSSFNSVVLTTKAQTKAMQQIGRALRNYTKDGVEKVKSGHANVYVFEETVAESIKLLMNLKEYDLTSDVFTWGQKLMIGGSGLPLDYDSNPVTETFEWDELGEIEIYNLDEAIFKKNMKNTAEKICEDAFKVDFSEIEKALVNINPLWFKNNKFGEFSVKSLTSSSKSSHHSFTTDHTKTATHTTEGKETTDKEINNYKFIANILSATRVYLHRDPVFCNKMWVRGTDYTRTLIFDQVVRHRGLAETFAKNITKEYVKILAGCTSSVGE